LPAQPPRVAPLLGDGGGACIVASCALVRTWSGPVALRCRTMRGRTPLCACDAESNGDRSASEGVTGKVSLDGDVVAARCGEVLGDRLER